MGTHPIFESDFDCLTDMGRTCRSFSTLQLSWTLSLVASFLIGLMNHSNCGNEQAFERYTPNQHNPPINLIIPMHIGHYSIITDIVKESKHADFTYIHDEADLIMDHYMVKEFNREYTSVKENSRLNQAGLPKVVMKDMHRHTIAGNAKHRHILTRHPAMTAYLRNNKKLSSMEYEDD